LINGGIYLVTRQFFASKRLPEAFSLEKDLLEKEAGSSLIKGLIFDELFIDIGLPEDYERAASVLPIE
jgi:D-glycero-alpha-D-manno-heptose 1-phosphate guanylyltransferase